MDSELEFRTVLGVANFGNDTINAIAESCAENPEDLARLPKKTLDTSILNLHKSLADLARHKVQLNATKCTLLHSIFLHFSDRINCAAYLEVPELRVITISKILAMKDDYLE